MADGRLRNEKRLGCGAKRSQTRDCFESAQRVKWRIRHDKCPSMSNPNAYVRYAPLTREGIAAWLIPQVLVGLSHGGFDGARAVAKLCRQWREGRTDFFGC